MYANFNCQSRPDIARFQQDIEETKSNRKFALMHGSLPISVE